MSQVAIEPSPESSLVGQTFDNKFRIIRLIGRGGMGEVFEAEHTTLGNRVAIKLMLEKYNGDTEAVARFGREALAAGRIGSDHIIKVMDIGTAPDGRAYVVMELLEGQPLSKLVEEIGQLPANRALRIMRQVLRAVGAAHAKGIVHRDLKPDNIFLCKSSEQDDFVKLLDFGISKIIDPDLQAAATKLTTTGVVMGTPLYMAPEQAMGNEIDHQADIYACGVIFYEMLAGRPPFEGQTYAVLVAKLLTTEPQLLNTLREGLPPKMIAAVHKALEKEPTARHASCETFLQALPTASSASAPELASTVASGEQQQALIVKVPGSGPVTVAPKRNNLLVYGGAAFAGVVVVAIAMIVTSRSGTPTPPAQPQPTVTAEPAKVTPVAPKSEIPAPKVTPIETNLDFTVTPTDAVITVDDNKTEIHNKTSVSVAPGKHEIHAVLAGFTPTTLTVEVEAGKTKPIDITLVPIKKAPVGINVPKTPRTTPATPPPPITKGGDGYTPPGQVKVPKTPVTQPSVMPPDTHKDNPYQ